MMPSWVSKLCCHMLKSNLEIEGIGAAEERVEGNRPVKGATIGFKIFYYIALAITEDFLAYFGTCKIRLVLRT